MNMITKQEFNMVKEFVSYFNSFYGVGGLYSSGSDVSFSVVLEAIIELKERNPDHDFEGDSMDREYVRDIVFTEEEMAKMYNRLEW